MEVLIQTSSNNSAMAAPLETLTLAFPPVQAPTQAVAPMPVATVVDAAVQKYGQCGGSNWKAAMNCVAGTMCKVSESYYSQCV